MKITSLPPIASKDATILILGTMPGNASLSLGQYYASPGNSFWEIMQQICEMDIYSTYEEKERSLLEHKIAVWDVLKHCEREGSLDSAIKLATEIPNEYEDFLSSHPNISHIFFNGSKAEKSFRKLVLPKLSTTILERVALRILPSTSPANTTISKAEKIRAWKNHVKAALA